MNGILLTAYLETYFAFFVTITGCFVTVLTWNQAKCLFAWMLRIVVDSSSLSTTFMQRCQFILQQKTSSKFSYKLLTVLNTFTCIWHFNRMSRQVLHWQWKRSCLHKTLSQPSSLSVPHKKRWISFQSMPDVVLTCPLALFAIKVPLLKIGRTGCSLQGEIDTNYLKQKSVCYV